MLAGASPWLKKGLEAMKIHDQSPNPLGPGQAGQAGQTSGARSPDSARSADKSRSSDRVGGADSLQSARGNQSTRSSGPDQVQLSNLSQELRVQVEDTPERLERVDQLRAAYRTGAYQPEAREVSKSIVEDALRSDPRTGL